MRRRHQPSLKNKRIIFKYKDSKIVKSRKDNQNLEDDEGTTVESRVISTSVKMLMKGAGRNAALVRKVFYFFAIFPEDVAVPASFFTKMLPILVGESPDKKAGRWAVGTCLSTLLKYNSIKGSLAGRDHLARRKKQLRDLGHR